MSETDKMPLLFGPVRDVRAAVQFLTRLPVGWIGGLKAGDLAGAAWAFPVAGLIVGTIAGAAVYLAALPSLHPLACALLGLGVQAWITGALHEDGLADVADGFGAAKSHDGFGADDRARRLDIMRDSRIGSFGVLALVFSVGLRAALLAGLNGPERAWLAMIAAAVVSRAVLVPVMAWVDPARPDGLAKDAGRPTMASVLVAMAIAAMAAFVFLTPGAAVTALLVAAAMAAALALWAKRSLGGQTGDVLGAMQQAAEIGVLIAAAGWGGGFL